MAGGQCKEAIGGANWCVSRIGNSICGCGQYFQQGMPDSRGLVCEF